MWKQVRVPRAGVAALLLVLGVVGTWQSASVQVPIIITLPTIGETTLFSDNFDSYPAGSFPSAGGWEVVWGGTGQNLIVSDPSVSNPNSFQLWGLPNNSSVIQRKFSTNAPVIGYEFSIRIEKVGMGGPGREESPGFFRREAATWGGYYARVFFDHDTRRIEGEGKVPLGMWSPQTWYKVRVVLDRRTNLYSVWIDGRLAGQNIRTEGDCYQINALALFSGHPGVKVWYDDVRVFTVAEGADSGLRATLQTSRGCGTTAVFQIGEPMQATFSVEGTGQAYVRLLNVLPTETKTVIQGTVNRGETITVPGTAGEPAGSRLIRLEVWENITDFLSGRQPATTVECAFTVTRPSVAEWHIDFQGDANHAGTGGQAGPFGPPEAFPGMTVWNVLTVAALQLPAPTPRTTNPSLRLVDKAGNPTGVTFSIQGDAYGWAGYRGADWLLGDYLIIYNAFGVTNNPTNWSLTGLAPNTRYCLTFYHAVTPDTSGRGLAFPVQHQLAAGVVGRQGVHTASMCVKSDAAGSISGLAATFGAEGNWAGLSIVAKPREDGDYGDAPEPGFPSRDSSNGPCHLDVSKEWIGPDGRSTTTKETDARCSTEIRPPGLVVGAEDEDDGDPVFWRTFVVDDMTKAVVATAVWFGVRVSYDPTKSSAGDLRYLNVLVDINGNGTWDGGNEWAVRNFEIPFDALPAGVSTLFVMTRVPDEIDPDKIAGKSWVRVTLSERPVEDGTGAWGAFARGETEDHLARKGDPDVKFLNKTKEIAAWPTVKSGAREGTCPHGARGLQVIEGGSPVFWIIEITPPLTKIEIRLRQAPGCQCPNNRAPFCVRLDPQRSFLVSPAPVRRNFAQLNTPPPPPAWGHEITPVPGPGAALGFVWGVNIVDGRFFWQAPAPGQPIECAHDCVVVELRITFDPDGDYGVIYYFVPVMLVPFTMDLG